MVFIKSKYKIFPCPFCGHNAGLCRVGHGYVIQCKYPACKAEQVVYPSEEEAVERWNQRVPVREIKDPFYKRGGVI